MVKLDFHGTASELHQRLGIRETLAEPIVLHQRLGILETLAEPIPRLSPPQMLAASLARVLATGVIISLLPLKAGTAPADPPPSLRRSAPLGIRGASQARKRGRTSGALACLQGDAESAPWIEVGPESRGDASVRGAQSLLGGIWCTHVGVHQSPTAAGPSVYFTAAHFG